MKQVQSIMSRWIKGFVTTASMLVFSVSLASGNDMTTTPNSSVPYTYTDPASTAPSYNNVGRPVDEETSGLMVNNEALGLSGPVSVSTGYSENFGYGVEASFSHMLGFHDAISLLGAYAPQENRIDITWAHAWTENQRTKLSVERLSEEMDFDYDSGSVTEWVPQYAYGAGYQYLFNKNWLKSAELSGYYAQAQSQDLSTVRFQDGTGTYDNYRHIAGATSEGSEATLNVSPWKTGLVGLGLNYDSVKYDTKYEDTDAEDSKGFGFTLSLEQLLSKHVKINLEGSQREVYDSYAAGVSFLTPVNLEVGLTGERTLGENGSSSDTSVSMNFAYFLDDHSRYQNGYNLEDASQNDLAAWSSKSLAYMDIVLAAADQKTVRVVDSVPAPASNDTVRSADDAPVITLTAGEINRVNIATYIESSNLTSTQKQSVPVITGGPADVQFVYENSTESLVTTTEVPETTINKEVAPLVLVFPSDTNTTSDTVLAKGILRDTPIDKLTFKVTVGGGAAPTLNPSFVSAQKPELTHAHTWVFNYENMSQPAGPADALTMFLNTNTTQSYLTMTNGYPQKTGDTNNCYTMVAGNDKTAQTLTITGKASSVCPGNATIKVVTNNGALNSPAQTITFTAQAATDPYISGGAIKSPTILAGQAYSPGHTFSSDEVSPGQDLAFNTDANATYLKVYDTKNGCVDVTSTSNLGLGFANNNTQAILQSTAAIPADLSGHPLKIYLHVTNNANPAKTADNGTTSNCGGTPFTATVEGAPVIPNNINLGAATVDSSYNYDFMSQGGVATGSSSLNTGTSSSSFTVNGATVSSADLGLAVNIAPTDVTLSGIVNPGYAGETVKVILNLTNTQGYSASNSAAPATLTVNANSTYAPSVAGGQTLTAGTQYSAYTYTFPNTGTNAVTAGTNEKFDTETSATYATVTNSVTQEDLSSKFALTFNAEKTQVTLTSGSNTLNTQDQINVVLHVANVDGQTADNAANPDHFNVNSNATTAPTVNNVGNALTATVDGSAYNYTYTTTPMTAGTGETFDTTATKAIVLDAGNGNADVSSQFALKFNGDSKTSTAITDLTASAATVSALKGPLNVTYKAVNVDGQSIASTTPDTIGTDKITVTDNAVLTSATVGSAYSYSFKASAGLTTGSTGLSTTNSVVTMTLNGVAVTPAQVGLTPTVTATDVTVSGTPNAGYIGTINLALNLTTPDGLVQKMSAASVQVDQSSSTMPTVNNVGNALTATVDGSAYNYTYTTTPMTAGTGETFDTTATKAIVLDAGNGNQAVSGFALAYSSDKTQITGLTASSGVVAGLKGPLNVTYTAVNVDGQSITSTTPDTIGTDKITVTDNAVLTSATVGSAYSYSFKASAGLTTGSTGLSTTNSAVTMTLNGVAVTPAQVGLTPTVTATDVTVSGTPNAGYIGTINLALNLKTPDGLVVKTSNATVVINDAASKPGYLYCPSAESVSTNPYPLTVNSTVYSAANRAGNVLGLVTFNKVSSFDSGKIQLVNASISNGQLTCSYGFMGVDTSSPNYKITTSLPADAKGVGAGWNGANTECVLSSNLNPNTADNSCQVTYTYSN